MTSDYFLESGAVKKDLKRDLQFAASENNQNQRMLCDPTVSGFSHSSDGKGLRDVFPLLS